MKHSQILLIAIICAGSIGIYTGRQFSQSDESSSEIAVREDINPESSKLEEGGTGVSAEDTLKEAINNSNSAYGRMKLIMAETEKMTPEEFSHWVKDYMNEVQEKSKGGSFSDYMEAIPLFSKWIEMDQEAAISFIANADLSRDNQTMYWSIPLLAEKDFALVELLFNKFPSGSERDKALSKAAYSLVRENPEQSLALLEMTDSNEVKRRLKEQTARAWLSKDFDAAQGWLNTLPENEKYSIMQSMAWSLPYSDREKSIRLSNSLPDGDLKNRFTSSIFRTWAEADSGEALVWLEENTNKSQYYAALSRNLEHVALENMDTALAIYNSMPEGSNKENSLSQIAQAMSDKDMTGSLQWLFSESGADSRLQQRALRRILSDWKHPDLDALTIASKSLIDLAPEEQRMLDKQIFELFGKQDPERGQILLESIEDEKEYKDSLNTMVKSWARNNIYDALEYVSGIEDRKLREVSVGKALSSYADVNPEAAAEMVMDYIDSEEMNSAFRDIASRWARNDSYSTSEWVNQLPSGEPKDNAASALIGQIYKTNLDDSFYWAEQIENKKLRKSSMKRIIKQWKKDDNLQAKVIDSDLPQEEKDAILNGLSK